MKIRLLESSSCWCIMVASRKKYHEVWANASVWCRLKTLRFKGHNFCQSTAMSGTVYGEAFLRY